MLYRGCCVLLLWGVSLTALAAPRAQVLEYGYYKFLKQSSRAENANATSGYVQKGQARLVEKSERIPVEKGQLFGFRFRIDGVNSNVGLIPLEVVVEHPPMKKPDGTVSTGYHYPIQLKLQDGVVEDEAGYSLNQDYELVEGEWRFMYRFMNKPLFEQRFTTYKNKPK